jgi:transcriptional regulator with XRE-family HTH domain
LSDQRAVNAIDQHIGERLRARRLEIGMSQEHLAERLGVTFQQVQKYEKGVNRVAASRLFDVAGALDVEIDYFFSGLTRRSQSSPARGKRSPTARPKGG